jgi:hypothetical protein
VPENWVVVPTCLPTIVRRCHACGSDRFRATGRFRLNANHKLLDAWLLALCAACGDTTKLTVFERRQVRSVPSRLLDRLHHNDPGLAAELLEDPVVRRRNRIALDWDNAWRLDVDRPDEPDDPGDGTLDVVVRFAARIPLRPVRLVAEGLGLSRAEVERLVADAVLVPAVPLGRKRSGDFSFTLKPSRVPEPTAPRPRGHRTAGLSARRGTGRART